MVVMKMAVDVEYVAERVTEETLATPVFCFPAVPVQVFSKQRMYTKLVVIVNASFSVDKSNLLHNIKRLGHF